MCVCVCACACACACVCMCARMCTCICVSVSNDIKLMSYVFIICCKMYIRACLFLLYSYHLVLSSCYNEILDITVVLDSSECLTIGRCLHLL